MATIYSSDVTDDFKKLYETKEDYDAIIIAGKKPNFKEFQVHSLILRTRSSYFHCAFSTNWAKRNNDGYLVLKKPNINALVFEIILKYLYCGIVDFQSQKNEIILELLVAADEFGIQRLINSVQEFLIQNCYKFLRSDPIKMLDLVICHNAFVNLKTVFLETLTKNCKDFLRKDPIKIMNFIIYRDEFNEFRKVSLEIICENPELLFNSDEYVSLEKGVLMWIFNCDDLEMRESEIWKRLIKWGIAKHPTLQNDITKFTLKDFKTLEKTLHELIQLVRFHQINGEEFMFEVWPYRHLISDNLIEDILHYFLVSNAVSHYNVFPVRWGNIKLDTVLVNKNFILLLSKWIDKKIIDDKSLKEIRYDFNLLFRSSIDGYSSRIFHQRCDNKGATIVIAKMSDSNMLVGGYNPLDWNGNNYKCTEDSFIFLLNDLNNLQSAKIGRVTNCNYAVYCNNDYGPNFGGGHDLYAPNNSRNWYCSSNSNILSIHCYPIIGIPYSFTISDYEVFQVVKN
ncbi:hypothetical protein C2G38_2242470 [Gigaspora rosea]|uniref:BTB/POZ domain-containing protein n=1 Tax=Gigaspora rosea TaxID=44941 RepID=A0A397VMQ8_9GLOM|nr:hypothetical protein C2G38_2242470 [Gigaspora rosea]